MLKTIIIFYMIIGAIINVQAQEFDHSLWDGKIKIKYFDYDWNLNKIL